MGGPIWLRVTGKKQKNGGGWTSAGASIKIYAHPPKNDVHRTRNATHAVQ